VTINLKQVGHCLESNPGADPARATTGYAGVPSSCLFVCYVHRVGNVERLQKSVNLLILDEFVERKVPSYILQCHELAVCGDMYPLLLVGDLFILFSYVQPCVHLN
jgi:hypothetical protein